MARMPDGWVMFPKVKYEDGGVSVEIVDKELVMCKNCEHYNAEKGWCEYHLGLGPDGELVHIFYVMPDYYCADGERRIEEAAD